jgi:hypothetical protein
LKNHFVGEKFVRLPVTALVDVLIVFVLRGLFAAAASRAF